MGDQRRCHPWFQRKYQKDMNILEYRWYDIGFGLLVWKLDISKIEMRQAIGFEYLV